MTRATSDLNPFPFKAWCSNLGFCGTTTKLTHPSVAVLVLRKGVPERMVSNCSNDTKQNSEPPKGFQRIGNHGPFKIDGECFWLKAKKTRPIRKITGDLHRLIQMSANLSSKTPTANGETSRNFQLSAFVFRRLGLPNRAGYLQHIRSAVTNDRETSANNLT